MSEWLDFEAPLSSMEGLWLGHFNLGIVVTGWSQPAREDELWVPRGVLAEGAACNTHARRCMPPGIRGARTLRWRRLDQLPLYGFGVSAGGAFLLKLPRYMKASEAVQRWCLAPKPSAPDGMFAGMPCVMAIPLLLRVAALQLGVASRRPSADPRDPVFLPACLRVGPAAGWRGV